nr:WD40 repeat domain-containing protein [Trichodesmium sp. MO_231.B1]
EHPAWQVITSASYDETALDALSSLQKDTRSTNGNHSPFAAALIDALTGAADTTPPAQNGKPAGDGVITATELYSYLRDRVETATIEAEKRQTPGLWHLKNHDRGEYIFLTPGHKLNLKNAPPLDESTNPYRGLESFREKDTQLFFGRTTLVEKLYDFVETNCLSVVLGASGSGKSSLVKAGLIPQLRKNQQSWRILKPIRPGASPFPELNNALKQAKLPKVEVVDTTSAQSRNNLNQSMKIWKTKNPGSKLLLLIDQSEELITLCKDESERQAFVSQLLDAITTHPNQLRVVITVRSDFEPQLRDLFLKLRPKLEDTWQIGRFIVPQMTRAELRSVIEKPAEARVMYFEPQELVEQLIDEVADMPGGLPLLSFALSELYLKYLQRQTKAQNQGKILDRSITEADYESIGGVTQSLTQRADEEYEGLVHQDSGYAQIIRHVMLRMVAIGGGELARRRVTLSELEYSQQKKGLVKEVIKSFTEARLLVQGKDGDGNSYVEPAHDALVRGWQKLLVWKQEDEEGLLLQRRLTPAAQEWKSQQQVRFLWHNNPRLDLLKKVSQSDNNWLNKVESEFVQRSVRRKIFNTCRNWGVAIAVILGLGAGLVFSLVGQKDALIGQIRASRQSAEANFQSDQDLEALLASLRAAKSLQDWPWYLSLFKPDSKLQPQVVQTLRKVFYSTREYNRTEMSQDFKKMFFNPDGILMIATAEDGTVRLQDFKGTPLPKVFSGHEGEVELNVSPDSRLLATTDEQGTVRLWNLEGTQEEPRKLTDCISGTDVGRYTTGSGLPDREISFSPDSKKLLYRKGYSTTTICLWETADKPKLLLKQEGNFDSISFNSNNQLVVAKGSRSRNTLRSPREGNQLAKESRNTLRSPREGNQLAKESRNTLSLSDYRSGNLLAEFKKFNNNLASNLVFSPNGKDLAGWFGQEEMLVAYFGSLNSDTWDNNFKSIGGVSNIIFDTEGRLITGQYSEGIISVYDEPSRINNSLSAALEFELKGHQGGIREVISSSSKVRQLASLGDDNTLVWWKLDKKPLEPLEKLKLTENLKSISISPDGEQLAVVESDDTIRLLDLKGNELKRFQTKIRQIIFSPDGTQLAGVGQDNTIRLLDLNGNELYKSQKNFNKAITQLLFSPDGTQLFVVEDRRTLDPQTNRHSSGTLHELNLNSKTWESEPKNRRGEITFSSDGKRLVAQNPFGDDYLELGNIFLREFDSGEELVKFKGGKYMSRRLSQFNSIGFSTRGRLVVGTEWVQREDKGYTYVWDMSGKLLTAFENGHQSKVTSISLSADGSLMATLDTSGNAKLWRIGGFDELRQKGCNWVRDYLENNPNVEESDRRLCDGVPELEQAASSTIPSPNPSTLSNHSPSIYTGND